MFYPVELLSHRRRGKLAPCWLAAMTSEKSFKRFYNSSAIKKINVVETCNEIQQVIQSRSRSDRFSLYLSSQLMCGITRIHSYQIMCYQKEAFEMQQKLDSTTLLKEKGYEFEAIEDLEFPEFPEIELPLSSRENFLDTQLKADLHILPGEDLNDKLQIAMQDATCLDFGCLNDEELNFMLQLDDNISSDLRRLQINGEKDISDKMADVTITEEIQEKQLSRQVLSPVLDVSKKNKSKEKLSLTPQKRQPHQMQVETPTKKRRLSFETAAMTVPSVPIEDVAVPVPELLVEETRMALSQPMETDMQLEPLHSSYFMINRRSKKSKFIDQKIALNDKQLEKWRRNVNIHCGQLDRPLIHSLTPAINLFKQPAHSPIRWNNSLRNIFVDRITGPFRVDDVAPTELVRFPEIMRVEETVSKLNLPTEDLSTFGKTDTAIPIEPVDSTVNILQMTNIIHETVDKTVSMVPLPVSDTVTLEEDIGAAEHKPDQERTNISNTDESFEDIEILLERKRRSSKKEIAVASTPNKLSPPSLTSQEILALLEVLWCDKEVVKFNELIPKSTYTRDDAATAFEILLELYAQKKLILQQIDCSRTLRILKYKD